MEKVSKTKKKLMKVIDDVCKKNKNKLINNVFMSN